jgi:hypothetical protein
MDVNPRYLELASHVLEWLETLDHFGVTSTLTMATGFVSNDRVFQRVKAFNTMVLDDLL